jgi:general secretion pathway protein L
MGRIDRALLFSGVALLLVALVSPFVLRHQSAARLEDELAQLRAEVREAETVRMELTERIERMRLIQSRNTAMPATLDILLELTRLIPDDAWAGQVAVKSGRVRLTGEASAASELLARLSNSAIFSDPKFEAPLTQNPRTGRERFVISLAIKGMHDEG